MTALIVFSLLIIIGVCFACGVRIEWVSKPKPEPAPIPKAMGKSRVGVTMDQAKEALHRAMHGEPEPFVFGPDAPRMRLEVENVKKVDLVDLLVTYHDRRSCGQDNPVRMRARGYAGWHSYPDGAKINRYTDEELVTFLDKQATLHDWQDNHQ
jgi:hypothetical protein